MSNSHIDIRIDRRQWILNNCKLGERVLDVGSADGWVFNNTQFRQYVTSIDIDKYDFPGFVQMDAHSIQFPDKSFDIVVLAEILEHAEDPIQILKEAKRVGKRILITVPDEKNWDEKYFPYETPEQGMKRRDLTLKGIVKVSNPNTKEFYTKDNYKHLFHNRHYTESTLKQDLKDADIKDNEYKLERLQYEGWAFFTLDINTIDTTNKITDTTWQDIPDGTVIIQTSTPIQIEIPKGPIITFGDISSIDKNNINVALSDKSIKSIKSKLRIALISTPFFGVPPQKYGGLEQIVWDLAESLDELGHSVTLFAPEGSKTPKHGSLITTGLAIDTVNVNWFKEEENRYHKWKDIVSPDRFDIIHDHTWFGFPYFHKMNNLKLRVIHTHHGGYQWNTAPPFPKPNLVAISKFMRDYTVAYFKQKGFPIQSEYVYNGIDLDKYIYQFTKTDNLLFVGRLSTFKQPHIAIEIARKTNHKLDIIGSASFVDSKEYVLRLEQMVENDQDIILYENASHELKIEKMQNAKALIVPSKMNEPFGLSCIEGMACGTPIICTRDGALSEIVIHNETGFICDSEEQMIEAVKNIDKIDPMKCRKRAEEFSRLNMAENYVELYQKMMNKQDW